ncbi:hypothetical protein CB1_000212013 [Camelus ferus]|nr:hypothetical protein CB1_000212013 [Camelus ferus]
MIMSSVTLLWSILHQADSSEKMTVAASASVTTINLGVTKVIPAASEEQLLLVELVRSISVMRAETVIQTVKEVLKQPPAIAKDKDVTHKIVDAIGAIAGSSLEQTTWLRRNLEVKPSPKIMVDGTNLESDVEDMLSPTMETSNITPSVYSVHALTLLSEVLAHLLDMVFYSDEKERVIPLLVNIMHYVVPYLRNHSAHNAPSYRACVQLLSSLSGYQYTRRAWKKEAFDLFMDPSFFQMDASCVNHWRAIMDNLMTHDKTTFRDLMTRVAVAQSSSLNLFANRDVELEQRAMLLKRLAFAIFSSEIDQYQKYLPDIQGK